MKYRNRYEKKICKQALDLDKKSKGFNKIIGHLLFHGKLLFGRNNYGLTKDFINTCNECKA